MGRLIFFSMLFMFTLGAVQAGVYKWVDEDGQIHFGDQPQKSAERVKVHKGPEIDAATQKRIDELNNFNDDEKEDDLDAEAQKKAETLRAQYKEYCEKTRERLATLERGGRLYEVDQAGERTYLTDESRQDKINSAKQDLKDNCD